MFRVPFIRKNSIKKASTHRVATSDPKTSKEILAKLKKTYPKEHFDMKLNWDEDPVILGSVPFMELARPDFPLSLVYSRIECENGHGVFYYTSEEEYNTKFNYRSAFDAKMRHANNAC